jgi:hypothetical protein
MRKVILGSALLTVAAGVLGATVFRAPIAAAATPFTNVIVGNTTSNPVPVSLPAPAPVTSGGGDVQLSAGSLTPLQSAVTATAISIHMDSSIDGVRLFFGKGGDAPAMFYGPNAGGSSDVTLPLLRPISFDAVSCDGTTGGCTVSWVGDGP